MIKEKKKFLTGLMLLASFFAVLFWIFTPTFGDGMNGLQFADDMFNRLSKGSSYFIPKVADNNEKFMGKEIDVKFSVETPEIAESAAMLFESSGAAAKADGQNVHVKGDLGRVLASALEDADNMYHNDGQKVVMKYGYDGGEAVLVKFGDEKARAGHAKGEKVLVNSWWQSLSKIEKKLAKNKQVAEAKMVSDVTKKAIEPGYNFYQVKAAKVSDHAAILAGLLVFYIGYTLWFGFGIFYLFEGMGLSMSKAKAKAEA